MHSRSISFPWFLQFRQWEVGLILMERYLVIRKTRTLTSSIVREEVSCIVPSLKLIFLGFYNSGSRDLLNIVKTILGD